MLVKDMISDRIGCLRLEETLRDAVRGFQETRLDALPVVDDRCSVIGVFTKSHLFRALLAGRGLDTPVGPFISREVVTVRPDYPFALVAEAVRNIHVGQAVVIGDEGRPVGMLTKVDVINALLAQTDRLAGELSGVLQAMHSGVVAVNGAGVITLMNPAAERLLGRTASAIVGMRVAEAIPSLGLGVVMETAAPRIGVRQVIGDSVVITNCTPIFQGGKVIGAIAVLQDLTEYERVAQELESVRKLHHTLETVVELAYDGLVVADEHGRIAMVNKAFAEFLGTKQSDAVGRHVTEVLEDGALDEVVRTGVPDPARVQVIRGKKVVVSLLPITEQNRVVGAVGKIIFRGLQELRSLVRRLESLENQLAFYKEEFCKVSGARYTLDSIIGSSVEIQELKRETYRAARSSSTVLLLGESGTGKELFAHAVHNASARRGMPFVKINCAAIPENLLESELFGYAEGAFTGAKKGGKPGKFELADGGTVFLDEIGDMSPSLQAKVLRVLQDREFERVGGTETIRVDVRIIAASNKDLEAMVHQGKFREDLYYRLNVFCLQISPLRQRKEDILPLVGLFINRFNEHFGTRVRGIAPEALAILQEHDWPGNVRELENVVERTMNLDVGDIIRPEHLPGYVAAKKSARGGGSGRGAGSYRETLLEAERQAIAAALRRASGNKTRAARMLGMSRSSLYEKLGKTRERHS